MKYVIYYRVSTKDQGRSHLGLDAQKTAVEQFLSSTDAEEVPPAFTEIESGKKNDRPELRKAIDRCKETGSTLLIAKLDRLARNVAFIFTLKEELQRSNVDFKALDLPEANTLTLGIMASMAQHEAEIISQRTKAGLAEAKRKGIVLGKPENLTDASREKARQANLRRGRNVKLRHAYNFIKSLREDKKLSYEAIAGVLNDEQYRTSTGKMFRAMTVYNIYHRFLNDEHENELNKAQ